jgi:hypothetical protein
MAKRTALITGASGGIGLELTRIFAREGYDLGLVARSEGKLNELAAEMNSRHGTTATVIVRDLSKQSEVDSLYDEVQRRGLTVDVLVNNAGFAVFGDFTTSDAAAEYEMMEINVVTLTRLTKKFLPGMKARGWGRVLNLASTAAFAPGPLMAVYYATKAYVLSFSEAIARELDGTGVTVTALCPGPTKTGFQARAAMQDSKLVQGGLMDVTNVAEQGYRALMNGTTVYVPGFMNKLQALAPRFLPRTMVARMVMNMQRRVGH